MEEPEPDEPPSRPQQDSAVNVDYSAAPHERQENLHPLLTTHHPSRLHPEIRPLSKWNRALRKVTAWASAAKDLICCSWINVLLIFVPLGISLGTLADLDPGIIFVLNALGIIPLAVIISASTEKLAIRLGDTWGALLNVTVGNTAELMIFFFALAKDQIDIVKASLLGSIATNLLLILGTAFLCGSIRYGDQVRDRKIGRMSIAFLDGALLLAILPVTIFAFTQSKEDNNTTSNLVLQLSRGVSIGLIVAYICYILLQMRVQSRQSDLEKRVVTRDGHTYVALEEIHESPVAEQIAMKQRAKHFPLQELDGDRFGSSPSQPTVPIARMPSSDYDLAHDDSRSTPTPSSPRESSDGSEPTFQATRSSIDSSTDHDSRSSLDSTISILPNEYPEIPPPSPPAVEDDETPLTPSPTPSFPLPIAILTLILSTALVSITTELAISRIPPIVASHNISHVLIGFVILPLVGNAAENVTAAKLALKNRTALAKNVAVESSSQIALLIAPAIVLLGWVRGRRMGFDFDVCEVGAVLVAVGVGSAVVGFGRCGWRQGVVLVGTYGCLVVGSVVYKGR